MNDEQHRCLGDRDGVHVAPNQVATECGVAAPVVSSLPMDDFEFREIVNGFVVRLDEQLSEMRRASSCGDLVVLAGLAHWLKGTGGSVGFDLFTAPAAALQASAEAGDGDGITKHLNVLEEIASRILVPDKWSDDKVSAAT